MALPTCQRWDVPTNFSSFDTYISLVNIVTQNMYSCDFCGSQHSTAPNCLTNMMSTIFRNWCQNRSHWKRSQFIVKSITPAKKFYFFIKHHDAYSWIFEYSNTFVAEYSNPLFFQRIPALAVSSTSVGTMEEPQPKLNLVHLKHTKNASWSVL